MPILTRATRVDFSDPKLVAAAKAVFPHGEWWKDDSWEDRVANGEDDEAVVWAFGAAHDVLAVFGLTRC